MKFSRMWLSIENTIDQAPGGNETILGGTKNTEMLPCDMSGNKKGPLVSSTLHDYCKQLIYNCELEDGSIYYYNEPLNCYLKVDEKAHPWGVNEQGESLEPYISVAVNGIPIGTVLEIKEMKNMTLFNTNKRHNGCVRVDQHADKSEPDCHGIHWYIGLYSFRKYLIRFPQVTVKISNCELLKYDL